MKFFVKPEGSNSAPVLLFLVCLGVPSCAAARRNVYMMAQSLREPEIAGSNLRVPVNGAGPAGAPHYLVSSSVSVRCSSGKKENCFSSQVV